MIMYKYGVSFNCVVSHAAELGGGGDGNTSVDYVSNDLEKLIAAVIEGDTNFAMEYVTEHDCVGVGTDVGGEVVGVFLEKTENTVEDGFIVAVLYKDAVVNTKVIE